MIIIRKREEVEMLKYIEEIAPACPSDCRGNRVLALPPARKGRQGSDTIDICAPHPWARAQSRPLYGRKCKSILLLLNMCILFAPRDTPDTHTHEKDTHHRRDIFSTDRRLLNKTIHKIYASRSVFNTEKRDLHPYASPEGAGRMPLRGTNVG